MKKIKKECRFYKKKYPEEGEHVMVMIKDVNDYSITVELLEYGRIEGMIIIAEYSYSKRSRYNKGILVARKNLNKKEICCIIRVDIKDKNGDCNFDLSRRKIKSHLVK